ncbi:hypothetical protein Q5762_33665 [Streptomyces sp. P9(2023)]|uniref:hypothetical protein n=1 Tax=Streptomyces sp. P9(2023) TaxID=3064394 RepID=UPI0028F3EA97|nr:hypothetical protein [Streptomyces sp. P9(2023)]MDT9693186.1 hypothetical protein [Streptomyces sp. P9(2023)]
MGIESDQLVFDYLSRVGDLAQQRQLPSAARMKLVSSLRGEIDRRRATFGRQSPAAIRGILDELGSPDEVVDRAAGTAPQPEVREVLPEVPAQRRGGLSRKKKPPVPKPRRAEDAESWPTPPHLAGTDEVGAADTDPDWWRLDDEVEESLPGDELVPGFRGGVEIPDLLKPPVVEGEEDGEPGEADGSEEWEGSDEEAERPPLWRRVLRVRRPAAEEGGGGFRLGSPVLVLAALLLLGGVIFGNLLALALGWLLAYASRRLSRTESQWAVVVLPALAAAAGAAWLWGRVEGRWGEPVGAGGEAMGAAVSETWPWTLKGAALASAAFLLWRARRTS